MKKAAKSDKDRVVKIICESLDKNPHVDYIIKKDKHRDKRMAVLAEYAFEFGLRREGVHLTDDGLGVAIIFQYDKVKLNLYEYWLQLGLAFRAFSISRALKVNNLENRIRKTRASDVDFLYLWFFGVADEALGTNDARELMNYIFKLSLDQRLPIYLETSLKRNNVIYKRFGLEDYANLHTGIGDLTFWFMRRPYDYRIK